MTMFILNLALAVFCFSVKSSSFALGSKARISLRFSVKSSSFALASKARISLRFSVKSSRFALASNAGISLHYSHLCTLYFKKTQTRISRLPFAVNAILNLLTDLMQSFHGTRLKT